MTFLARGVWGSLPMVTMSGPDWTIFSTSRRILRRSMSRFLRTLAATPEPSLTRPRRMCSVPTYSWLNRCASWLASCITLRARSVKRSYMGGLLRSDDCPHSAPLYVSLRLLPIVRNPEPISQRSCARLRDVFKGRPVGERHDPFQTPTRAFVLRWRCDHRGRE